MLYKDCKPSPFGVMPGDVKKCAVMNMMHSNMEKTTTTGDDKQHNTAVHNQATCCSQRMVYDKCDHYAFGMMPDKVNKSPVPTMKKKQRRTVITTPIKKATRNATNKKRSRVFPYMPEL
jgi:hypothetical protein